MRRKKQPLEKLEVEDQEGKAKVSVVLQVLSGEKSVAQACRETGLKPLAYYKMEDRMVAAMLAAAKMPPGRGKRKDALAEASSLAEQTQELRQEHQRMQSLLRITKKLFRVKGRKTRSYGPRRAKIEETVAPPATETPRRESRTKVPMAEVPAK